MIVKLIDQKTALRKVVNDPKDERLEKFRSVIVEIASKLNGRITGWELRGTMIRVTFASKDVADGVVAALKERKVGVEDVALIDEYFDELGPEASA